MHRSEMRRNAAAGPNKRKKKKEKRRKKEKRGGGRESKSERASGARTRMRTRRGTGGVQGGFQHVTAGEVAWCGSSMPFLTNVRVGVRVPRADGGVAELIVSRSARGERVRRVCFVRFGIGRGHVVRLVGVVGIPGCEFVGGAWKPNGCSTVVLICFTCPVDNQIGHSIRFQAPISIQLAWALRRARHTAWGGRRRAERHASNGQIKPKSRIPSAAAVRMTS